MGTVKVVKNQYRPDGAFHQIEAGTPIKNESGQLCGVTKPRNMTYIHSYGGEAPFFQAVSEQGRLLGTRCTSDACAYKGTTYLPFRIFCPDCLEKMEIVDATELAMKEARVHTYIITERSGAFNTLEKPIRFVDVEFPGVDTILKGYLVGPGKPEIGVRVKPVFRTGKPMYNIQDLAWVLEDTTADQLPEGFAFAGEPINGIPLL